MTHTCMGAINTPPVTPLSLTAPNSQNRQQNWDRLLGTLFERRPLHTPATKDTGIATLTVYPFGGLLLAYSENWYGSFHRNLDRLSHDRIDHILITAPVSGQIRVSHSTHRQEYGSGCVCVVDLASPVAFSMKASQCIHLIAPRIRLPETVIPASPRPPIFMTDGTGQILSSLLVALFKAANRIPDRTRHTLTAGLLPFLTVILGPADGNRALVQTSDLRRRLHRYIEQNLTHADLTPAHIAQHFALSRSRLYRLFEDAGGVETYIRQQRLWHARQALSDIQQRDKRIGDIAFEWGFPDEAYFSRLFRAAYGCAPRDLRISPQQARPAPVSGTPHTLLELLKSI